MVCRVDILSWVHTHRILIHDMLDGRRVVIEHWVSDPTGSQSEVSETERYGQHLDIEARCRVTDEQKVKFME